MFCTRDWNCNSSGQLNPAENEMARIIAQLVVGAEAHAVLEVHHALHFVPADKVLDCELADSEHALTLAAQTFIAAEVQEPVGEQRRFELSLDSAEE